MRILQTERIGDRRVRLIVHPNGMHAVTLEVLGPANTWEDISLQADQRLLLREARQRYAAVLEAQHARLNAATLVDR